MSIVRRTGRHMGSPWRLIGRSLALLVLALAALVPDAQAQGPLPSILETAKFDQKMGAQVPLDLTFRDERGQPVRLGDLMGSKPTILTLNYYNCPNLCPMVLDGAVISMVQIPFNIGKDFNIVTVSIEPKDTPELASKLKDHYVRRYNRPGVAEGWHFLTGDDASIKQLAQTVGFNYAFDALAQEYAHPSGVIVLTPEGQVSRYIYGVNFIPRDLRLALVEASENKIGSPIDDVLLFCYRYDPEAGSYGPVVMNIMRLGGLITLTIVGICLLVAWGRELSRRQQPTGVTG